MQEIHQSVLLKEVIEGLNIKENTIIVDATLGFAGHSNEILKELNHTGLLIGIDQDINAIETSNSFLSLSYNNFKLIHSNYSNIKDELEKIGIKKIDSILFDLGVSSFQLDNPERGFSYRFDGPLDMRMDESNNITAYTVVNSYSEQELTNILFQYGEEKYAKLIAKKIIEVRKNKKIKTTFELVDIIRSAVPNSYLREKGHPAKRTFQAIRIEVNDELNNLKKGLLDALSLLNSGGRCLVITFHSLEDRIVKKIFNSLVKDEEWTRGMPITNIKKVEYRLVNNKVILPTEEELLRNNRSHSAKLRIIEKL